MTSPFQPITKEAAAQIMSVSKRTIDNWLADGTIVEPSSIGRRVYWHPEVFYRWLNERLGVSSDVNVQAARPPAQRRGRPRATSH